MVRGMKFQHWETPQSVCAGLPGLPALVGRVLAHRGFTDVEEAREFLRTDPGLLHDPALMRDLPRAAARLEAALERGETIAVYGDYDVDGVTATCLLYDYFRSRGGRVVWYVPRRLEDGYGLTCRALDALKDQGVQVVVTVDCGITAVEEARYAKDLGLELIITDHHACKDDLPQAYAVVDPHRSDCPYPFRGLAGVGVALKLAMAMGASLEDYADLAALGTVADVMPLADENRAIVHLGLEKFNGGCRPGLKALLEAAGIEERVNSVTLGYALAPRINAAGRLGVTEVAVELLLSQSLAEARPLAQELCELNRRRQALEAEIYAACAQRVEAETGQDRAIVLAGEDWHQGVVGIVASRLTDRFHKPTFMIALDGGVGKGSCRGVEGLSLFEALQDAQDLLLGFGGHAMAAGFTVREENIPALRQRLNAWVAAQEEEPGQAGLHVDVVLPDAALLTEEEVMGLELLEPLGAGNPKPVFSLSATLSEMSRVGQEGKHMRLTLLCGQRRLPGIFFSCPQEGWTFREGDRVEVAFTPQINEFRGRRSVQLVVQDLRPDQPGRELYERFAGGGRLTREEAQRLIPSRAEFAQLWRYLRARAPLTDQSPMEIERWEVCEGGACHTLIGLDVFRERGLIRVEGSRESFALTLTPPEGKVDLEDSQVLRRLHTWARD